MGTVTSVHHQKSGVLGVQYPVDTRLYGLERHLLFGLAEEGNVHLLEVREKTPDSPPNKAPANPEPQLHPPRTPEEDKKTDLEAHPPTNPTPALWDRKEGS